MSEEIMIKELLNNFNIKLYLPNNLLNFEISSDFLNANFKKDKMIYTFTIDDVKLIINPVDKIKTIQKFVINDNKIIGGVILGYKSMEYLN